MNTSRAPLGAPRVRVGVGRNLAIAAVGKLEGRLAVRAARASTHVAPLLNTINGSCLRPAEQCPRGKVADRWLKRLFMASSNILLPGIVSDCGASLRRGSRFGAECRVR